MTKCLYLVQVLQKGREADGGASGSSIQGASDQPDPGAAGFVEAVRASNRREAMILVKRKYPDHLVLDKVVKAR
jgi:hypothetical protein